MSLKSNSFLVPYNPKNPDHISFCLKLLFNGTFEYRFYARKNTQSNYSFSFYRHRAYMIQWVQQHFHHVLMEYPPSQRLPLRIHCTANDFLSGALKDDWRFGQHWHLPDHVMRNYSLDILRHWAAFKARLFLFVTRRENSDRSATTLSYITLYRPAAQQIHRLLNQYAIPYTFTITHKKYFDHWVKDRWVEVRKKEKIVYTTRCYKLEQLIDLFQQLGWQHECLLQNFRIQAFRQFAHSYLHRSLDKKGMAPLY